MFQVAAVALIVLVGVALAFYGPVATRRRGAREAAGRDELATVPAPRPAANDPVSKLVDVLRRKRGARILLSLASIALLLGAIGMIGYPFYTNLVQSRIQGRLDRQLASPELEQAYRERRVQEGQSLTRIKIPALDVDVVVVEGTSASALRAGAGHYPATPLPCEIGNVAIAGHRTTYGKPFQSLEQLKEGDEIILETPIGICTYKMIGKPQIIKPTNVSVVANTPTQNLLTLTTCHPKGSAKQRLVVQATMVSSKIEDA
jgi:sortase A